MTQVSVVIPTCQRLELLKRAIRTVLAQSYTDFEVIVVNDGEDISLAEFNDPRLKYIKNLIKRGGGGSRNEGVRSAMGEYIAFLDDDDRWLPNKLEIEVEALKKGSDKAAFAFTSVTNEYEDRTEVTNVPEGEANQMERVLAKFNGFLTSTLLVKRDKFNEIGGFDESFPSHQEPDLILRLSQKYNGIGINKPLTIMSMFRTHEHIGSSLERRIAGRVKILAKHKEEFAKRPKVLAKHYFRIGLWQRDSGHGKEAREYFKKALNTKFTWRYLYHYLSRVLILWK